MSDAVLKDTILFCVNFHKRPYSCCSNNIQESKPFPMNQNIRQAYPQPCVFTAVKALFPGTDCRSILIMTLVVARGGSFGLEQPGSSLMPHYDRFRWLYRRLRVPMVPWQNVVQMTSDRICARSQSKSNIYLVELVYFDAIYLWHFLYTACIYTL